MFEVYIYNIFCFSFIFSDVRYDKKSEAEMAIEQMNGIIPDEGNEPLVVKVAEEHGKMKAAYYAGYHAGLQTNRGGRGQGGLAYIQCYTHGFVAG